MKKILLFVLIFGGVAATVYATKRRNERQASVPGWDEEPLGV
jgi:hypothetical protein